MQDTKIRPPGESEIPADWVAECLRRLHLYSFACPAVEAACLHLVSSVVKVIVDRVGSETFKVDVMKQDALRQTANKRKMRVDEDLKM